MSVKVRSVWRDRQTSIAGIVRFNGVGMATIVVEM